MNAGLFLLGIVVGKQRGRRGGLMRESQSQGVALTSAGPLLLDGLVHVQIATGERGINRLRMDIRFI